MNTLDAARTYLDQLDLSYIVDTLCAETYPLPRWNREAAWKCCQRYKNFLFLQKKYPSITIVPSKEIDEFWHQHILHTANYCYDSQQIFGSYLHHVPLSPTDDTKKMIGEFLATKELYLAEFNEAMV